MNTKVIGEDRTLFMILFVIVSTVIASPLIVIDQPLLADYPNHVARMHVIGNVDHDMFLDERYEIRFDFIPNIMMDLLVPWLAALLPLDVAARIFLSICLVSTLASVAWLHRVLFNRWYVYPLLAAFFVHHGSMLAGMANFALGIGLVPAALALWIQVRGAKPLRRLLIGSAAALGLFFCHLVAFAAYGLLVLGIEIAHALDQTPGKRVRDRLYDLAIAGATGLLPLFLFLRLALIGDGQSTASELAFGSLAWKLKAVLAPLAHYSVPLDVLSFALLAGLGLIAWLSGRLEIARRMVPCLILLTIAFLLAPKALWTGGVFDQRLATLLALMLVACTRLTLPAFRTKLLTAMLACLLLVRTGVLTDAWIDHRGDLAEMRRAIQMIPPGSRILVARQDEKTAHRLAPPRHIVFHHAVQLASLPALAVIEKSAFVSTLYALPGQQPLSLKPPFDRLGGRGSVDLPTFSNLRHALRMEAGAPPRTPETSAQIRSWTEDFDHVVLLYGYGPGAEGLAGDLPLEPMMDGEILDLFRIAPAETGPGLSVFPARGCRRDRPCPG